MTIEDLCQRMAALGNPSRMEIYRLLVRAGRPGLSVASVQERVGIPASTLSHHLRRLVEVGLVLQERTGTTLLCSADFAVMEATFALFAAECCADEPETSRCDTSSGKCC
ncbi:Helix-turn-helix domain protein [Planctomycetes bacterium Poly30]|uniref:Helix-turn-helix domain protein n=1 Tax=Saltatorellus ferox TaxID=2528018 RepID=A0A518EMH6_9BACT|nr:Helix-turn-helix domain protein [Planctomycetes bacterium Poly30]